MPPTNRLNQLLTEAGSTPLSTETAQHFADYLKLLQHWNARTNLTAIRDEETILRRHFVESILCARNLPTDIVSLLDFGSGAGFPGLPIALIRNEIAVTLAESQHKKAAFLREAIRTMELPTKVHAGRAEDLPAQFDCVTLRAVDHMEKAVPAALRRLKPRGWLAILTTLADAPSLQTLAENTSRIIWQPYHPLPQNTDQILLLGQTE